MMTATLSVVCSHLESSVSFLSRAADKSVETEVEEAKIISGMERFC